MKEQLENYSNLILDIKDDKEFIFTCVDMVEFSKQYATEQLRLHDVSQQRELLLEYEKSKCPETWWVSKRQTECEIEDFLANNCG